MYRIKTAVVFLVVTLTVVEFTASVAMAQIVSGESGSSSPKQAQSAQRKASHKAARARKNAQLEDLEKNGYQPGGDQLNYPQNFQSAERKAAVEIPKSGSAP